MSVTPNPSFLVRRRTRREPRPPNDEPATYSAAPGQWSTVAGDVDWMYSFIYWLSVAYYVAITAAAIYVCIKSRRRPGVKAEPTGHNTTLEVVWTVIPIVLLVFLFHKGFEGWLHMRVPPANALEIRVRAKKWAWDFEYPNGMRAPTDLHVPVHTPVRLVISSDDVLHSFFVPAFRIKQDATPGFYQTAWFEATHTGTTDLFCAEYCGTGHSLMLGHVIVQTRAEYDHFLAEGLGPPADCAPGVTQAACWGERMYHQSQCVTSHSTNGSAMTGPTWRGLYGRHEIMQDGLDVHVDENYIRESILTPQAKIVRGFQPVMPTFQGQLQDRQIDAIIAYMRTLH